VILANHNQTPKKRMKRYETTALRKMAPTGAFQKILKRMKRRETTAKKTKRNAMTYRGNIFETFRKHCPVGETFSSPPGIVSFLSFSRRHKMKRNHNRQSKRKARKTLSNTKTNTTEKSGAAMADGLPPNEPSLPADDAELLYGTAMIGRWLGLSEGQARALIDDGTLPTFRMPGRSVRCALKSELNATVREYARRPGAAAKAPSRRLLAATESGRCLAPDRR
jgi:hypothetical protein